MPDLKIFTDSVEPQALNQINTLINQPAFKDCKVRIMPDVHAGIGCVIGFTADLGDKVIPNIVGVDIGCGIRVFELGNIDLSLEKLDDIIRAYVPSGRNTHIEPLTDYKRLKNLYCYNKIKNMKRIENSIGTLGGGNHFIEVDVDDKGNKYLVIHTGSRNLGKQVAEIYQKLAMDIHYGKGELPEMQEKLVDEYFQGRQSEVHNSIKRSKKKLKTSKIPKDLCYLEGEFVEYYLHDMHICQEYAVKNREYIGSIILNMLGIRDIDYLFETVHNYIDYRDNIVRKGAISAHKGERVLIPLNMRDGCILGVGLGNHDWNCSAPHGAGRIMSRSAAKKKIAMDEYSKSMQGVFSTSIIKETIDEAPMAYKPSEGIINAISETVEIQKILKPIYNYKAAE
ncbi:MAG: RtcB family protein [Clostridiales bacterium]|nr:RtcB family protein [Clostridiales bacterium]